MFKRLLIVLVMSFVFIGQAVAQEATPDPTFNPRCLAGYKSIPGFDSLCYHPTGGTFNFSYRELLSGQQTDVSGSQTEVSHLECPLDDHWATIELISVQLCLPRDSKKFYIVTDLLNGEASSFPELKPNVLKISVDKNKLVTISSIDPWFEASADDKHLPNMLTPHAGGSVGHPLFVLDYWGQHFVAVLDQDGTQHFAPMRENLDLSEDWSWMIGLKLFNFWGHDVTERLMS